MPAPLSADLQSRIIQLADQGTSSAAISKQLLVSRSTVNRLRRAAQEQQQEVPAPKPMGGHRHARLTQEQKDALVALALENRKRTAEDVRQCAIDRELIPSDVYLSTIYRALRQGGLTHGRLPWKDPKTQTDPLIVQERELVRHHQQNNQRFMPERLLFFDESNYRLWEQATRGWKIRGQPGQYLFRPKGVSPRVSVFVTIGAPDILHYKIYRPKREYPAVSAVYDASELDRPGKGLRTIRYTNKQIRQQLTCQELRDVLREHGIKTSGANKATLITRVLHLKTEGKLGLPRPGRRDVGGQLQPVINTAADVWRYFRDDFVPSQGDSIRSRSLVMNNASTHGAPPLKNSRAVSFLHVKAREDWSLDGVIWVPPRSPTLNPVELVFAWTKRKIRKRAPDQGYTEEELVEAIHNVFAELRSALKSARDEGRRTFIDNWLRKSGYGHLWKRSEHAVDDPSASPIITARWPGYGDGEPNLEDRIVIQPTMNVAELGDGVYELEDIVDEESRQGVRYYMVSWVGYEERTWIRADDIVAGREALERRWARRRVT